MDIQPKLSPRQEYALLRISEIIKETEKRKKPKMHCYIKLTICALIITCGYVFMPYSYQKYLHAYHESSEINTYAAPDNGGGMARFSSNLLIQSTN